MKDRNDSNNTMGSVKETGIESMKSHYGRAKQSFPLFWIFGFLGSCFFIFMGAYLVIMLEGIGALFAGIFFWVLGVGLLTGVLGSFYKVVINGGKDNMDFSITLDIDQALSQNKYSAENLVRKVHNGRNNVVTINTKDGFFRFYGYDGRYIAEIRMVSEGDFRTYHLTVPDQMDDSATVLATFFERFPTRKNRIVSDAIVVSAVQKLYEIQSLDQLIYFLPYVDTTAETKNLIMKDAYIIPEVPINIISPTSEEGKKKTMREQMAMQELQNYIGIN